ncbi:nucleotide pyrophosphohydrolase [Microbacterium sp. NPDC076768]|uniref:nucleotide pyrophosphohydrolase n=1 Tax=Microbacterium sp. NPDC076768 TaxID=3154858 RepID=UPI0034245267
MPSEQTLAALRTFVAERDWDQFHSPENLSKSIAIEASELLECFQWSPEFNKEQVETELADVLTYCILLANKLDVDIDEIVTKKLNATKAKYPIELAKGNRIKYTELTADA